MCICSVYGAQIQITIKTPLGCITNIFPIENIFFFQMKDTETFFHCLLVYR